MKSLSVTFNGARVSLKSATAPRSKRQKFVASTTVRGLPGAQAFIVVYLGESKAARRARLAHTPSMPDASWAPQPITVRRGPGRPPKSRVTPPVPRPSPPQADDVQAQTLRVLQAMTRRLDALEGRASIPQGFYGKRRPQPQPSA